MSPDFVGGLAALLTTASFVPQALKVLRSNDTEAISLAMYDMFSLGVALWLAFGLMIASAPIIAANAVTLALAALILTQKIRHGLGRHDHTTGAVDPAAAGVEG